MTQGAVKTAGKRSQAVSAKSTPSSVRRWRPFHSSAFTARARTGGGAGRGVQNQSALLLPVERGAVCGSNAADPDIWLAPLKAFRQEFAPLVAIKEYIRLKLEVSRDYPQASRLFCLEMLQGAPLLKAELTGI